jgi:Na+/proline symporter
LANKYVGKLILTSWIAYDYERKSVQSSREKNWSIVISKIVIIFYFMLIEIAVYMHLYHSGCVWKIFGAIFVCLCPLSQTCYKETIH